ncbi:hypothetical protein EC973_008259 [Apophysomyces ossiformis]|uniref:F-box domain-containing protein n=1 Tax=Apophysomyces ossiformis TaxID=679940 RepID=A0A8H7BSP2_9FUNG|nr:hypothetical protein EC973_008259 [Apophysomyces ossiformis]
MLTHSFPNELYSLLWSNLSTRDQYTCLLVCRSWYLALHHLLYREVIIHRRTRFTQFCRALQSSSSPGHYVRKLQIEHGRITRDEVNNVLRLCPLLENMDLPFLVDEGNSMVLSPQPHHRLQQLKVQACPASLNLVCTLSLTHLSLRYSGQADERLESLLQTLSRTPNLVLLSISDFKSWITIQYMETIHSLLPHLKTLEFLNFNHSLAYQPLSHPTIVPCQLQTFRCRGGAIYQPAWLLYVAFKYPDLVTLDLEANVDVHLLDRHEVEIGSIDTNKEAMLAIAQRCRNLQVARWINFAIDDKLIDNLPLHVHDLGFGHFDGLPSVIFHRVARLRLTSLMLQGTATIDVDELAIALSQCDSLRKLTIDCGYPYVGIRRGMQTASTMDIVHAALSHCHNIDEMSLRIAYSDKAEYLPSSQTKFHALKRLVLVENSLDETLFKYLARYCPNLSEMCLWQCCRKKSHDGIEFVIHMPQHALSVDIQNFYEHSLKWSRRCKLFGLTRPEGTRWYYMCESREVEVRKYLENCHYEIAKEIRVLYPEETLELGQLLGYEHGKHLLERATYKPGWQHHLSSGIAHIYCKAINSLTINKKRVI